MAQANSSSEQMSDAPDPFPFIPPPPSILYEESKSFDSTPYLRKEMDAYFPPLTSYEMLLPSPYSGGFGGFNKMTPYVYPQQQQYHHNHSMTSDMMPQQPNYSYQPTPFCPDPMGTSEVVMETPFLQSSCQQKEEEERSPPEKIDVQINLVTTLKEKYWRNGRRNLQCFPNCRMFGDYADIAPNALRSHDFLWGKCRGGLEVEVRSNLPTDEEEVFLLLGRIHSVAIVPVPFDESVYKHCMLDRVISADVMEIMRETWITAEQVSNVDSQETAQGCRRFEFKPKVWKYTDDKPSGKSKRRNARFYVQMEAFVPQPYGSIANDAGSWLCVGSGFSKPFEVGSSRVLARKKRKEADEANGKMDAGRRKSNMSNLHLTTEPITHIHEQKENIDQSFLASDSQILKKLKFDPY